MDFVQAFVRSFIKSTGLKRKLSAAFQTIALAISTVPQLQPFASVLTAIAGWLGLVGVAQSSATEEVRPGLMAASATAAALPLPTIAAFFNALVLATDTITELQPYKQLFLIIASILSAFSTATTLTAYASSK